LDTGLITARNFTGCLENLYLNSTNVIHFLKNPPDFYYYGETAETFYKNNTFYNCPNSTVVPVTFLPSAQGSTHKAFIRLKGYEGIHSLNVTFEFRTYQDNGVILFHKFTSNGFCKLFMDKSKLMMEIQADTTPRLVLDNFATDNFNDGLWHRVIFSVTTNAITLSVDERMVKTARIISIFTGGIYYFGGELWESSALLTC
jgi:contactin associated protein-like 2